MNDKAGSSVSVGLVVFHVGEREYGVRVERAVEIIRMVAITPVPESETWLAGVLDLRGRVIPVVDLRRRLGFPPVDPTLSTPIVVVESSPGGVSRTVGLIADDVTQVIDVDESDIEPPDDMAGGAALVCGVVRTAGRLIVLLDVDRMGAGVEAVAAHSA